MISNQTKYTLSGKDQQARGQMVQWYLDILYILELCRNIIPQQFDSFIHHIIILNIRHNKEFFWADFGYLLQSGIIEIRPWIGDFIHHFLLGVTIRPFILNISYIAVGVRAWMTNYIPRFTGCNFVFIPGTLDCVFTDNEIHESSATKCTTGEAWSAFYWHYSSVFRCRWTHDQVILLLSHMLI